MIRILPLLVALIAMSCQSFIIGLSPQNDSEAFLESMKTQDVEGLKRLVVPGDTKELESIVKSLELIKESDSSAASSLQKSIDELNITECFLGSSTGICSLNNGTQLRLQKDGLSWKVDLSESSFIADYTRESRQLTSGLVPRDVAIAFGHALLNADVDAAQEVSTGQAAKLMPLIIGMMSSKVTEMSAAEMNEAKAELETMECEVEGEEAKCGPTGKGKNLELVRVDGKWKVTFKKKAEEEDEVEEEQ